MFDLAAEIAKDRSLPANSFHINGSGPLEEGISLELNHPLTQATPAIIVGSFPVYRDRINGCFYDSQTGRARRIELKTVELRDRDKSFVTLIRPSSPKLPLLLHVDPSIRLASNASFVERFQTGVVHNGTTIAWSRDGEELISFSNEDAVATIFYADGSVKRIVRKENALATVNLSIGQMADARIEHALIGINAAKSPKDADFWYHQIVSIMAVGGRRSESIFDKAYAILEDRAANRQLSISVHEHATTVLKKHWPSHAVSFAFAFAARQTAGHQRTAGAFGEISEVTPKKKGPSAEATRRRHERSERDRQIRNEMRGSSNGGQKQDTNKGKKK